MIDWTLSVYDVVLKAARQGQAAKKVASTSVRAPNWDWPEMCFIRYRTSTPCAILNRQREPQSVAFV